MPSQNRKEQGRNRDSRYPRMFTNINTGRTVKVDNSDMDYLERVKQYINLEGIKTRGELTQRLMEKQLLGKHRQYKQINIVSDELNLSVRGKVETHTKHTQQKFYKGTKSRVIYRDKKTGRFMKKPK